MGYFDGWAANIRSEMYLPWEHKNKAPVDEEVYGEKAAATTTNPDVTDETVPQNKQLGKYWTIVAAGTGLFSDGYVNNSIGSVSTILSMLYPKEYANSPAQSNVASIAFAGTVFGMLSFGYFADHYSRKIGMLTATFMLIIFTILCAGAWGAGGSIGGMLAALTAYRFFIGVSIGGEYASGSTATAEASNMLSKGHRNRWFVFFTNFMIDLGFVVSAFTPLVCLWIFGLNHLTAVWRLTLGLGAVAPLSLLYIRTKFQETENIRKYNIRRMKTPYWLLAKYYGPRLVVVSLIWFIYDFSAYSFGIYSSTIVSEIVPGGDLYKTFGWNVVINLFYMPGSALGAFAADYIGPRLAVVIGMGLQSIVGFAMASQYEHLKNHIAGFVVVYGIFLSLGEFGAGDQIGLIASKTSASAIRGQYYGIAAAVGKIGAFVGTYVFPIIIRNAGGADTTKGNQAPFYVSASLCLVACLLALFGLPHLGQDAVNNEDANLREYLEAHGVDVSLMGNVEYVDSGSASSHESEGVLAGAETVPFDGEKKL